jgi:hypothetical protein
MHTTDTAATPILIALGAGLMLAASTGTPAWGIPEPGPAPAAHSDTSFATRCELQRVGTQFVRCDDLTGAGVPAPSFVPELR